MSRGQTLKALVNERLTAAADEIFALFERTIAQYEEELCRYREEPQLKEALLSEGGPGLDLTEPWIKQEPQEESDTEEQPLTAVPEFITVCVKSEESSLLPGQTEYREETHAEDNIGSELLFQPGTERDTVHVSGPDKDDKKEAQCTCSCAEMEAEVDVNSYNQDKKLPYVDYSHLETRASKNYRNMHEANKRYCLICNKMKRTDHVQTQKNIIETPYSCSFCHKTFAYKNRLDTHIRVHTGEKPFKCSVCDKGFAEQCNLKVHFRTHTRERPYSCSVCDKTYRFSNDLKTHMRTHTGERPYSCSLCPETFKLSGQFRRHMRAHTGGFHCATCDKSFNEMYRLKVHMRTHTGEKPYSCAMCNKTFAQVSILKMHMTTHSQGK